MTGKKKVWFVLAAIATLLLFASGFSWAWWFKTDPQVEMVRALQAKAFSAESRTLDPEERRAVFAKMREESEKLTDEQRRALREEVREGFQGRMQERIGRYFELSGDERVAYLDAQIDEMEARKRGVASARAKWRSRWPRAGSGKRRAGRRVRRTRRARPWWPSEHDGRTTQRSPARFPGSDFGRGSRSICGVPGGDQCTPRGTWS